MKSHEDEFLMEPLTCREHEVMTWLERGLDTREAADAMGLSINTVKFHLKNIYSKLGVYCRADALNAHRGIPFLLPNTQRSHSVVRL